MNDEATFILNPDRRSVGQLYAEEDPVTQVFRKASVAVTIPTVAGKTDSLQRPRRPPPEERTTVYLGDRESDREDEGPTGLWKRPEVDEFELVETQSYGPDCIVTAEVVPPTLGRRWIGLAFIAAMLVGAGTGALLLPV